jgi:hypothetical protein
MPAAQLEEVMSASLGADWRCALSARCLDAAPLGLPTCAARTRTAALGP